MSRSLSLGQAWVMTCGVTLTGLAAWGVVDRAADRRRVRRRRAAAQ